MTARNNDPELTDHKDSAHPDEYGPAGHPGYVGLGLTASELEPRPDEQPQPEPLPRDN